MTPILSHLTALIIGFLIATLIMWTANRKQQKDWQAEYRRLMGGIDEAMIQLDRFSRANVKQSPMVNFAIKILSDTYRGE